MRAPDRTSQRDEWPSRFPESDTAMAIQSRRGTIPARPQSPTRKCPPNCRAQPAHRENPTALRRSSQQHRLRDENHGKRKMSCTQCLHQSHFRPPFKHRGCHRGRNRQPRGEQRGEVISSMRPLIRVRMSPSFCATRPNLLGMRMRDCLVQLERNRLRIRRAIPAVPFGGTQRIRIAARKIVFGLGHRAHVKIFRTFPGLPAKEPAPSLKAQQSGRLPPRRSKELPLTSEQLAVNL